MGRHVRQRVIQPAQVLGAGEQPGEPLPRAADNALLGQGDWLTVSLEHMPHPFHSVLPASSHVVMGRPLRGDEGAWEGVRA
eukprot:4544044-Pyramimonas_sp.AAC.1